MKCLCGEKVPLSHRRTLKQVLELNAALMQAAEHEDLMNDMKGSKGTSLAMTRDLALQRGEDPDTVWPSKEEVQEAIFAERSETWKLGGAVLEQLHEVAHGRAGTIPSERDLQAIKLNLMAGPGGHRFLTEDDVRRLQDELRGQDELGEPPPPQKQVWLVGPEGLQILRARSPDRYPPLSEGQTPEEYYEYWTPDRVDEWRKTKGIG